MPAILSALVNVFSADITRAMEFYGGTLGLTETYRFAPDGETEHVEYRVGTMTIAISTAAGLARHGMPPPTQGHSFELGLETDNVDALVLELRAKGVPVLREPFTSPAGNRVAYVADPDGTWVAVYSN